MNRHTPWYRNLRHERDLHGWSKTYVAGRLGVDLKTVSRWEKNLTFPSPQLRQKLALLFNKSVEDLNLLEEADLASAAMIDAADEEQALTSTPVIHALQTPAEAASEVFPWLEDWGEAPDIDHFYGRTAESEQLEQWLLAEHCRIVIVLGIGGVGKTTFATMMAHKVKHAFACIFWRSLRNAPSIEHTLESLLQFAFAGKRIDLPHDLDGQMQLLLTFLRDQRCLLVFDNVESVFQEGQRAGRYALAHSGYGRLFQMLGSAEHQSCLLLTSREKPQEVMHMEGLSARVRLMYLKGMAWEDGHLLLQDQRLSGSEATWTALIELYSGNPLALKLVAEPIRELFGGDIATFLREEKSVFGDIHDLLTKQFQNLSLPEQQVLYWLGMAREPVMLRELRTELGHVLTKSVLLDALDSLRRRSLVEVNGEGVFSLQPVVMEYVIERFVEQIVNEITGATLDLFGSHPLIKALAKEYIRESQVQMILAPLAQQLSNSTGDAAGVQLVYRLLPRLHQLPEQKMRYAAGNVLNLLVYLGVDLHGLDCSHLSVQGAYLQDVVLRDVNFAYADLAHTVLTDTFSSILGLAVSHDGTLLAAGTTTGELRLWRIGDGLHPLHLLEGHIDGIRAVAFSPAGHIVASASEDQTVRLWEVTSGECVGILSGHTDWVRSLAFSPDGQWLASSSEDHTVKVWDVATGRCMHTLTGHTGRVRTLAVDPCGTLLASGGDDCTIRLWSTATWDCQGVLQQHTQGVRCLVFSPDGERLVSGSEDHTIRLWQVASWRCLSTLSEHTQRVSALVYSSDGVTLASCSDDQTIRLWDVERERCIKVLQEHKNRIWSLACVPGKCELISASEDQTLRFWDMQSGFCFRTLRGHTSLIKSIAFSPDSRYLADGTEEQTLHIYDLASGRLRRTLTGHANRIRTVSYSPDGVLLASASEDETIRLWDVASGRCLRTLRGHTHLVRSICFAPSGDWLVSCSYDQTMRIWDVASGRCLKVLSGHEGIVWGVAVSPDGCTIASVGEDHTVRLWDHVRGVCTQILTGHEHRVWSVAFHPAGMLLASAGDDCTVRLWDLARGSCLHVLQEHSSWTRTVAFSPDGYWLASGSHDATVRLWEVKSGSCRHILRGHRGAVWSVAFHPHDGTFASGGDDGTIRRWKVDDECCLQILGPERPYEGVNITGVRGLVAVQKEIMKSLGAYEQEG